MRRLENNRTASKERRSTRETHYCKLYGTVRLVGFINIKVKINKQRVINIYVIKRRFLTHRVLLSYITESQNLRSSDINSTTVPVRERLLRSPLRKERRRSKTPNDRYEPQGTEHLHTDFSVPTEDGHTEVE